MLGGMLTRRTALGRSAAVWEKTSHNRRQLTWSQALRKWAGLHREKSDDEIVQHGDDAVILPKETLEQMRHEVADVLDTIEVGGVPAAESWLRSRSLHYLIADGASS